MHDRHTSVGTRDRKDAVEPIAGLEVCDEGDGAAAAPRMHDESSHASLLEDDGDAMASVGSSVQAENERRRAAVSWSARCTRPPLRCRCVRRCDDACACPAVLSSSPLQRVQPRRVTPRALGCAAARDGPRSGGATRRRGDVPACRTRRCGAAWRCAQETEDSGCDVRVGCSGVWRAVGGGGAAGAFGARRD